MNDLKNKTAYITGGSKGIGFGVAQVLLSAGMRVAISSRSLQAAQEAANKLGNSDNVLPLQSDVALLQDEERAAKAITDKWGSIDVVVANAGVGHFGPIDTLSTDDWNHTINTNLTGPFHTVKATLDALKQSKGYIITIASLAGTNFFEGGAAYNASKFGLVGFTQAIMLDLRRHGIKVSTIMPGSVATYFNGHEPSEKDSWKIQPEDVGQLVLNLLNMHPRTLPSKIEVRPSQPGKG